MQDECPKQLCTLENEFLEFAFFDSCRDEGSAALLLMEQWIKRKPTSSWHA